MSYAVVVEKLTREDGVELSTMMKAPCLRYRGDFIAMMFDKADALIIKVAPARVDELIAEGLGREFNLTGKRFREWVLIPRTFEARFEELVREALNYAQQK